MSQGFKQKLIDALIEYRRLTNTTNFLFYFHNEETFVIQEGGFLGSHILVEVGERFDFPNPLFEEFPIDSDPSEVADKLINEIRRNFIDKLIKEHGYAELADALEFDTEEQFKEWYESGKWIDETDMILIKMTFGEIDT